MKDLLLLTATIKPPAGAIALTRTDPRERLSDYARALRFYCSLPPKVFDTIVFSENSQSDLSVLRAIAEKSNTPVEFHSFEGLDYPPTWGRAYGEFRLLDYTLDSSVILKSILPTDRIWKVTGRYRVLNIKSLIRSAPTFDLYCDIRSRPMPWADLRVFSFTKKGYEEKLRNICTMVKEDQINIAPEVYLHPLFLKWSSNDAIKVKFSREPRIDGIRGKDSKNYLSGVNLVKYAIRTISRTVGFSI